MSEKIASRRAILKAGALLAAPLAAAAPALAADEGAAERLARIEDEAALRALLRDYVRSGAPTLAGAPGLCGLVPDLMAGDEAIAVDPDRRGATARLAAMAETETLLDPSSTFAQMAIAQGGGRQRTRTAGTLVARFARAASGWRIAEARFEAA